VGEYKKSAGDYKTLVVANKDYKNQEAENKGNKNLVADLQKEGNKP